jgi:hypothetical protein
MNYLNVKIIGLEAYPGNGPNQAIG